MKKLLLLLLLLLPLHASYSQKLNSTNTVIVSATDPTGNACSSTSPSLSYGTGNTRNIYTCQSGVYAVGTGSGAVADATITSDGKQRLGEVTYVASSGAKPTCNASSVNTIITKGYANRSNETCKMMPDGSTYAWADDNAGVYDVTKFGAVADGSTDNAAAIQAAHDAASAGDVIFFPPTSSSYRVRSTVTVTKALTIRGDTSKILFDFPNTSSTANGKLFSVSANNVFFEGLWFDGTGLGLSTLSGNRHAIYVNGTSGTPYTNVTVKKCRFTNLLQYAGTLPAISEYSVPVRFDYTNRAVFDDNYVDTVIGWGVFLQGCNDSQVTNNRMYELAMSPIQYYDANNRALIENNQLHGVGTYTRYWGGSIDILSQHSGGLAINKNIVINKNTITGKHMYGGVIRVGSIDGIEIANNTIRDIEGSYTSVVSYINIAPRGAAAVDMSARGIGHINIHDNHFYAGGTNAIGVYIFNSSSGGTSTPYAEDIKINNNEIISIDASNYFINGIIVHGSDSGTKATRITGNLVSSRATVDSVVGGHVVVVADGTSKKATDNIIRDNKIYFFDDNGGMAAASTSDNGILVGQYSENTFTEQNTISKHKYGVYIDANATTPYNAYDNIFLSPVTANVTGTTGYSRVLIDPALSIAKWGTTTSHGSLKNSTGAFGAELQVRTATDSGFFVLSASAFRQSGDGVAISAGRVRFGSAGYVTWTNNASFAGGIDDLGLCRVSAGLLEVNNGTCGTLRDLKLRDFYTTSLVISSTAPTITSAGTSPTITANGTAAFVVNVGTGGTATDIVLAMPTATTGWICHATNITATAANRSDQSVRQTASTTTSVTLQNQTVSTGAALAFTASDVVRCQCTAY